MCLFLQKKVEDDSCVVWSLIILMGCLRDWVVMWQEEKKEMEEEEDKEKKEGLMRKWVCKFPLFFYLQGK